MVRIIPIFRIKPSKYRLNGLWNANKFRLMYESTPKSTIGIGKIPGEKKTKQRLTFLACANGNSTEKFPLFIIDKSHKPHICRRKTNQELSFGYSSNPKA